MKNKITLLLFTFLFSLSSTTFAKQINTDQAKKTALKSIAKKTRSTSLQDLKLVYTAKATLSDNKRNQSSVNLYYVFNIGNNNGFIITSADDINVPIIGHSDKGEYDINNLPENYRQWMQSVEQGMIKHIAEGNEPSDYVKLKWSEHNASNKSTTATNSVSPLITTKWNQSTPYNNMTPVYNSKRTYTGCVATAMAQIMKYHEHPKTIAKNIIIPGYTSGKLGIKVDALTLTSNTFDWNNMADIYNSYSSTAQENAVAKLMYYCGVSVEMDYNVIGSEGSSASTFDAAKALMDIFDYDNNIDYKDRISSQLSDPKKWSDLVKNEIDNQRPVLYAGSDPEGGAHIFICDGYNDNDEFHFNWGWGGSQDGYYNINAPLKYTNTHRIVLNITPNKGGDQIGDFYVWNINYPQTVGKGQTVGIRFAVTDDSMHKLTTDYDIALYDLDDNFICIINAESCNSQSIGSSECTIPETILHGTYQLKAIIKQKDGTYKTIRMRDDIFSTITIPIEKISHFLYVGDTTILSSTASSGKAGDKFTVKVCFGNSNNGGVDFEGDWGMALIDKDTHETKHILSQRSNQSLQTGYYYKSYNFTCTLPSNIVSGEYKLMMCAKPTGTYWAPVYAKDKDIVDYIDFMVDATTTGIDETTSSSIKIYPNPVTDMLHIVTNSNILKAQIYNTNGNLITETNNKNIDVQNLNKGIYILKIETEEGASVHKINKQ